MAKERPKKRNAAMEGVDYASVKDKNLRVLEYKSLEMMLVKCRSCGRNFDTTFTVQDFGMLPRDQKESGTLHLCPHCGTLSLYMIRDYFEQSWIQVYPVLRPITKKASPNSKTTTPTAVPTSKTGSVFWMIEEFDRLVMVDEEDEEDEIVTAVEVACVLKVGAVVVTLDLSPPDPGGGPWDGGGGCLGCECGCGAGWGGS
jgi:DNA-directed RNA polymerase subunit RPC12/RpoP